jgi:hypothetical protein
VDSHSQRREEVGQQPPRGIAPLRPAAVCEQQLCIRRQELHHCLNVEPIDRRQELFDRWARHVARS